MIFDRPESGANILDAATMKSLRDHLDAIENDSAIRCDRDLGKEVIFVAGADLQTLLRQGREGRAAGVYC